MPALQAFGRRWHVGSDDFVLPGICDLIIRISWFIATAVVYWQSSAEVENDCSNDGGGNIRVFLYGTFATLQLIIFSDIALVHNSKAGSVMNTEARRYVPLCLYIRTLLVALEIGFNATGTYWFSQGYLSCPQALSAESLVQGLIICNWLLAGFTVLLFLIMFDSLGGHAIDLSQELVADPKLSKCWALRWRLVCLYWWTKNEDIKDTFRDLGAYLAAAFESTDMVFSDLVCGLVLLYLKNREVRQTRHESLSSVSTIPEEDCGNDGVIKLRPGSGVESLKLEEWNTMPLIHHFYQYAVACYSWGVVMCTAQHPLCALWKDAFCCGCIRKNPSPTDIEGDCCCFIHSGSARDVIRFENAEIVYCSFHDKVFQTPFIVAADHGQRAIVVAIRGTMSRADVVTDVYCRPISLARFGYPESYRVHGGMLMNALKVHERLTDMKMIPKLLAAHPGYKIVTTGTSLGSASATLLALVLRKEWPEVEVHTFAYSPSGALMNLEATKHCESFVTSVIYGDDFVARLAVKSVERLIYDMISILRECRTPKYQILVGSLLSICGCRPRVTFSPDMDSTRRESRQELISALGFDYSEINVVPMEGEKHPFYLRPGDPFKSEKPSKGSSARTSQSSTTKLMPFELMYPPGRLLHITETPSFRAGRRRSRLEDEPRWNIRWADRQEFREILVTSRMAMDHVPFRQNKALQDLSRKWSHVHEKPRISHDSSCESVVVLEVPRKTDFVLPSSPKQSNHSNGVPDSSS